MDRGEVQRQSQGSQQSARKVAPDTQAGMKPQNNPALTGYQRAQQAQRTVPGVSNAWLPAGGDPDQAYGQAGMQSNSKYQAWAQQRQDDAARGIHKQRPAAW